MPRTLGMIKTSDCGAAVQNRCLYLKLLLHLALLCVLLSVAHAFDGVKLIYLKPCESAVMLGATFLAILA